MSVSKETEAEVSEAIRLQRKFRDRMERCFGASVDFDELTRLLDNPNTLCHGHVLEELVGVVKRLTETVMDFLETTHTDNKDHRD